MSRSSRAAWRLSLDLARHFGLCPGAVEVRWALAEFPDGHRWGWVVSWAADGPTVEEMRAAVDQLAGRALAAEVQRGFAYHRARVLAQDDLDGVARGGPDRGVVVPLARGRRRRGRPPGRRP